MIRRPPRSTPLSLHDALPIWDHEVQQRVGTVAAVPQPVGDHRDVDQREGDERAEVDERRRGGHVEEERPDRKSTRLNSSHANISYAVFCLKKKKKTSSRSHRQ